MPIALISFSSGVEDMIRLSAEGIIPAASAPCANRATMSHSGPVAAPQASEASVKPVSDQRKTLVRPTVSASRPAGVSTAANITA